MEVGKKSILNGFIGGNNSTQFVIPIYQRNYVWGKENVNQLLKDIERMIPYIDDENKFHFFGSIVYIDTIHKGSFNEWTIIDGQQRLTTIFLLLQAMRVVYVESNKVISKKYLLNDEDIINSKDEYDRYRLKPLVSDDNVYLKISKDNLNELSNEEKNSNIYKAYNIIKTRLLSWKNKYDIEKILNALDKFKVVWIQLSKNEDPQQVFESINSTGVNLTAADLIRNFILMNKSDNKQTQIYNEYWKIIEFKNVTTSNLKEFFRFYVSIIEKTTIPEREVYERFKNEYNKLLETKDEYEILEDIKQYSKYYYYIKFNFNGINNEKIEQALKDYQALKTNMPTMIIMEVLKLFDHNLITDDEASKTIKLFTTYIVRRNVCGEDTKAISNMFGNLLGKIMRYFSEKALSFYECVVKALVNDTRLTNQIMPTDKTVKEEFQKSNLYSREVTSLILKKIENNESHISYEQLNIEHVMPQTSTDYWQQKINENSSYEEVVNRIGNLTLVDSRDNSIMGNKDFESKKNVLKKSRHIKLNEDILQEKIWNEDKINKRSEKIAEKFIEIFQYPELIEEQDIYAYINLKEETININNVNIIPLEISIGDESNSNIQNWTDVLVEILKYLYRKDNNAFIEAANKLNTEYGYKSEQITSDNGKLRAAILIDDDIFVESNTNTNHKLVLLQRMINIMNIDTPISITYIKKEEIL